VPVSSAIAAKFQAAGQALSGCTGGQPDKTQLVKFNNNTIPSSLLDANAQAMLKAGIFPSPNSGSAFIGGGNAKTTVREEIVRIDHHFNDKFWLLVTGWMTLWTKATPPPCGAAPTSLDRQQLQQPVL
jgi:hypothetical protein